MGYLVSLLHLPFFNLNEMGSPTIQGVGFINSPDNGIATKTLGGYLESFTSLSRDKKSEALSQRAFLRGILRFACCLCC